MCRCNKSMAADHEDCSAGHPEVMPEGVLTPGSTPTALRLSREGARVTESINRIESNMFYLFT